MGTVAEERRADSMAPRRDIRNESAWLPEDLDELLYVTGCAEAEGHPPQVAKGLGMWLVEKALGLPDKTSAPTRSRYRKILASLEAAGHPPPAHRQAGAATLGMLLTVGLAAAVSRALTSGDFAPLLALLEWLQPIIYGAVNPEEDEPESTAWPELLAA
jgi:hypothetical protein